MALQREYLVMVGREGFEMLDSYLGRKGKPVATQGPRREGFEMLDSYLGPKGKPVATQGPQQQQQKQKPHAYNEGLQVPPMKHSVIDCYEAADLYGGTLFVDNRKPVRAVYYY